MKKLLVTVLSLLCVPLIAQVLQPLGSGLPLSGNIGSGTKVVASYAAGNEYLALFNDPSTPDTTDYTVGRWNGAYWSYYPGLTMPIPVKLTAGGLYHFSAVVLFKDTLYVSAFIESPTDVQANVSHLYKWNGNAWVPMNNTIESTNYGIMAMTVFNKKLIVAGRFQNNVDGALVDNIAAYDGINWSYLGKTAGTQGTDGDIKSLISAGNRLYIAGDFQKFAGTLTGNIAYYVDTSTPWGGIGSPFTGSVQELAYYNNKLAAIGNEISANSNPEVRIFANSTWTQPLSFSDFSIKNPHTIAGADKYLLIGGEFVRDGNGTSLLRYENDSLFFTGNRILGNFKLGQRGSEAFIWGDFEEQNTGIKYISKIETNAGDVTGTLFFDKNQNFAQDNGEQGLGGVLVRFEDASGSVWFASTQADGTFAIALPEGNYTIGAFPGKHWLVSNPTNYAVKVRKGLYSTVELGQYMAPNTQDLELHLGAATPSDVSAGDEIKYVLRIKNTGNTVLNGPTVHLTHADRMQWVAGSPEPDNYDAGRKEATYTILNLQPGETRIFTAFIKLPADATTEDEFTCDVKAGSLFTNNDAYKTDNFDTVLVNLESENPDGSVFKMGTNGEKVNIAVTQLDYRVKFVNISNTLVNRVVLLDTLDPNVKLKYLLVYDLYPQGDWRIVKSNAGDILVAEYPNANLSSRESNKSSSSGYIKYYMQLATPLQHNDQVHNRASCDFNSEWTGTSNTVVVTMQDPNIGVQRITGNIVKLYPNPTKDRLELQFEELYKGAIEVVDYQGRVVLTQMASGSAATVDLTGVEAGLYVLRTKEGSATFIVAK